MRTTAQSWHTALKSPPWNLKCLSRQAVRTMLGPQQLLSMICGGRRRMWDDAKSVSSGANIGAWQIFKSCQGLAWEMPWLCRISRVKLNRQAWKDEEVVQKLVSLPETSPARRGSTESSASLISTMWVKLYGESLYQRQPKQHNEWEDSRCFFLYTQENFTIFLDTEVHKSQLQGDQGIGWMSG